MEFEALPKIYPRPSFESLCYLRPFCRSIDQLILLRVFCCLLQSSKMDLNSLKDQVSNLTLYDIKAGVRKVQNGISVDQIFDVRA